MSNPRHGADIYEPMYDDLKAALEMYYDAGVPYAGIIGVLETLKHDILHEAIDAAENENNEEEHE